MSSVEVKPGDRVYIDHWNFEAWGTVQEVFHGELLPIQVTIDSQPPRSVRVVREDILIVKEEENK